MHAIRQRLPNRRPAFSDEIAANNAVLTASAGFDPATGRVRELFFSGAKSGSAIDLLTQDAAVVISVALQHGIPAERLARSIARTPTEPTRPEDLDATNRPAAPASLIGAALDWIIELEPPLHEDGGCSHAR